MSFFSPSHRLLVLLIMVFAITTSISLHARTPNEYPLKISNNFKFADQFVDGYAVVQTDSGWGLIDRKGETVLSPQHDSLRTASNGRVAFRNGNQWGFKTPKGEIVVQPQYNDVTNFSNNAAAVKKDGHWGYINRNGKTIVSSRFDKASPFKNGRAIVTKNNRVGFIDRSGEFTVPARFNDAHPFSDGLAPVERTDLWGYVDREGRWRIKNQFTWASPFHEQRARVTINGLWGLIDRDGNLIDTYPYEFLHNFHQKRALFEKNGRVGYLGPDGDPAIPAKFERGNKFNQGLAAVRRNGRWGFIGRDGNWVIKPQYQLVSNFSDSHAAVKMNRRWGYIPHPGSDGSNWTSAEIHQPPEHDWDLDESLLKDFPLDRRPPNKRYVSIGKGFVNPEWHVLRESEIKAYQRNMAIYEVTGYPYSLSTSFNRHAAEALYRRSLRAAIERGWFDHEEALKDGFVPNSPEASHFHNEEFALDGKSLIPTKPEYLVYNLDDQDELQLSGFMYVMDSNKKHGPQVAGPLTKWHFHMYDSGRCFKYGSIILPGVQSEANCNNGVWIKQSPEMIHVWFVDHPDGQFGTRMDVPPNVYGDYYSEVPEEVR